MKNPLVSMICLAYNHEKYVLEALQSVINQSYTNIETIIVDDASTDRTPALISDFAKKYPPTKTLLLSKNLGNCRAFNLGFQHAKGKYIIDFATDDVLHPDRIARQVAFFENLDERYGVIFSDAFLMDFAGNITQTFYKRNSSNKLLHLPPSGNIYGHIIGKSYICSPTMMIRRDVLEKLKGYDEHLSYEDYDFWVRSARQFWYGFQDEILTSKRILSHSHGKSFYKKGNNRHLESTLKVHQKAFKLNQNPAENRALVRSVRYHLRLAFYTENFYLIPFFANLLQKMNHFCIIDRLFVWAGKRNLSLANWYTWYQKIYHKH